MQVQVREREREKEWDVGKQGAWVVTCFASTRAALLSVGSGAASWGWAGDSDDEEEAFGPLVWGSGPGAMFALMWPERRGSSAWLAARARLAHTRALCTTRIGIPHLTSLAAGDAPLDGG